MAGRDPVVAPGPVTLAPGWPLPQQRREHRNGLALLARAEVPVPDGFDGAKMMAKLEQLAIRLTLERALDQRTATAPQHRLAADTMHAAAGLAALLRRVLGLAPDQPPLPSPDPDDVDTLRRRQEAGSVMRALLVGMGPPAPGRVLAGDDGYSRLRLHLVLHEVEHLANARAAVRKQLAGSACLTPGSPKADARLVCDHLMPLYEAITGRRCGVSINRGQPGEGLRFLVEAAKHCGVRNPTPGAIQKAVKRWRRGLRQASMEPAGAS